MLDSRTAACPPLCVLHVDDHAVNRRLVEEVLAACGHEPFEAGSGADALQLCSRRAFDVILMDINMPGMSGIEAVGRLRSSVGPATNVPVIALTSEVNRRKSDYLVLGFDDFVAKPFDVSKLLSAIEGCARRRPVPQMIRSAA